MDKNFTECSSCMKEIEWTNSLFENGEPLCDECKESGMDD